MKHASPRVFVLIDPAQEYEESNEVIGVFGSLKAAKYADVIFRRRRTQQGDHYSNQRTSLVEERRGFDVLMSWHYDPETEYRKAGWSVSRANLRP